MADVLRVRDFEQDCLGQLLTPLGLNWSLVAPAAPIPNSYWGDSEAGIDTERLWLRSDTPLHSLLHEACHWLCARSVGRTLAGVDAGSDDAEECAVCYLQVLLADTWPAPMSRARLFADMDAWGYSFREGSAERWFHGDGRDARQWLISRGMIDDTGTLTAAFT